jgi:hypothetical protein
MHEPSDSSRLWDGVRGQGWVQAIKHTRGRAWRAMDIIDTDASEAINSARAQIRVWWRSGA